MPNRVTDSNIVTELDSTHQRVGHLCELKFDTGTVRISDMNRDVTFSGNLYTPGGHFVSFTGVEETAELQVRQARFTMSGVDQLYISAVLNETYLGRDIALHRAFFDSSMTLIGAVTIFEGIMDKPTIALDPAQGKATVTIMATNNFARFERTRGRRTNHEENQLFFPGDKGFLAVTKVEKSLVWGS